MFTFLRDKIKATVERLSKKVDQEATTEIEEKPYDSPSLREESTHAPFIAETTSDSPKSFDAGVKDEEVYTAEGREQLLEDDEITPLEDAFMQGEVAAEESAALPFVDESGKETPLEETKEEIPTEQGFFRRLRKKFTPSDETVETKPPSPDEKRQTIPLPLQEKIESQDKGIFGKLKEKIITKKIDDDKFDELFFDLEVALLENNVAVEVIEKIKQDLKVELVDVPLKRGQVADSIIAALKQSIETVVSIPSLNLLKTIEVQQKPYIIAFVGINGSGKTTTIAKMAHYLKANKLSVVLAAGDTFRAAAIDQLEYHANKLGVKIIKHDYGSDPAAVAFDAIAHAKARNVDVVLIDTAGRLHSNTNLIDEMKKIVRVAKPHLKLFIGEAITGNDCVLQAKQFDDAIGIDGIILSKADIDEKGGAFLSVGYVTQKPILFIGTGQDYKDLKPFEKETVLENLGLD